MPPCAAEAPVLGDSETGTLRPAAMDEPTFPLVWLPALIMKCGTRNGVALADVPLSTVRWLRVSAPSPTG